MTKPVPRIKDDPALLAKLEESGAVVSRADRKGVVYFARDRFVSAERVEVTKVVLRDNSEIHFVSESPEEIRKQLGERTNACPIHAG